MGAAACFSSSGTKNRTKPALASTSARVAPWLAPWLRDLCFALHALPALVLAGTFGVRDGRTLRHTPSTPAGN